MKQYYKVKNKMSFVFLYFIMRVSSTLVGILLFFSMISERAFALEGAGSVSAGQKKKLTAMSAKGVSHFSHLKESEKSSIEFKGVLRGEGMHYWTPLEEYPQLTEGALLTATIYGSQKREHWNWEGSLGGGTLFKKGPSEFYVPELNVGSNFFSWDFSLGRKISEWSLMEQKWSLPLWEPQLAVDTLRPVDLGLTGLFIEKKYKEMDFKIFLSPLFIPSMGPEVKEEDGLLVAESRWYRVPSKEFRFNNKVNTIVYKLDVPEVAELVSQSSTAVSMGLGDTENGFYGRLSMGYKPVNELLLKRKAFKSTSEDTVKVTVSPEVTHHTLSTLDLIYRWGHVGKISLTCLEDQPEVIKPQEDWVIQKLLPMSGCSLGTQFNVEDFLDRDWGFEWSYLSMSGGEIQDITSAGTPDDFTLFKERLRFKKAFLTSFTVPIFHIKGKPLITQWRWIYETIQKGSFFHLEMTYSPKKAWTLLAGTDILGVMSEESSGFLKDYRANDRIYAGMVYEF